MKKWVQKLVEQFDFDWNESSATGDKELHLSEDRATLLYIIDTYNKHLIETDRHPVRKVREVLDEFAKELVKPKSPHLERTLFRFRQFFTGYRIDEYSYIQKTFDDFRNIVWDFVDQLSEDLDESHTADDEIKASLQELKEAVESNSIESLKSQSRKFIDIYMEHQFRRDSSKQKRMDKMEKNLTVVKKKLVEAHQSMKFDHLTSAYNRKSFDEQLQQQHKLYGLRQTPVSLIALDIDHFKRINDSYGHAIGDCILKECVRLLQEIFGRPGDFVARVGGEEFAVILPDFDADKACIKASEGLKRIANEIYVHEGVQIRFTVSMGVAELAPGESVDSWVRRSDEALYQSKNSGRNRYTLAKPPSKITRVA